MERTDSNHCYTFVCSLLSRRKGLLIATGSNFYPVCRLGDKLRYLAWTKTLAAIIEVSDRINLFKRLSDKLVTRILSASSLSGFQSHRQKG
jgi:hypothetical protein